MLLWNLLLWLHDKLWFADYFCLAGAAKLRKLQNSSSETDTKAGRPCNMAHLNAYCCCIK